MRIFVAKLRSMIVVLKETEITYDNLVEALEKFGKKKSPGKKTLIKHFGKLKRGIDGLEYQKVVRNEWD